MRNYLLHFFIAGLLFSLPFLIFSWWAEPIYGDLTRIGKWTEHDFGPNAMPPLVQVKASGRSLINSDVTVLGDSFSERNLWQSVLSDNTSHVVKSFHYKNNCISNWIAASISDSTSKIIIVETVERAFVGRFKDVLSCPQTELVPLEVQAGIEGNLRPNWPLTLNFPYLSAAAINTVRLNIFHEKYSKRFTTVNTPLRAGCALFSSRRNDRLLYYADDNLKQEWNAQDIRNAVANVMKIQKEIEQSGKKFVLIIAPDKSSAYQNCLFFNNETKAAPNIIKILVSSGVHVPDLHTLFKANINTIIDLYNPDNTHWSEAGYILAGNEIGEYISMPEY